MTNSYIECIERDIERQMKYMKLENILTHSQSKLDSMKLWGQKSLPIFISGYIESLMDIPSSLDERFHYEKAIGKKTKEVLEYASTLNK